MTVTILESLDGIREKATKIASIDELETGSSTARWSSPGTAVNEKTKKVNELLRALVGEIKKETLSSHLTASQRCGET